MRGRKQQLTLGTGMFRANGTTADQDVGERGDGGGREWCVWGRKQQLTLGTGMFRANETTADQDVGERGDGGASSSSGGEGGSARCGSGGEGGGTGGGGEEGRGGPALEWWRERLAPLSDARSDQHCLTAVRKCSCGYI